MKFISLRVRTAGVMHGSTHGNKEIVDAFADEPLAKKLLSIGEDGAHLRWFITSDGLRGQGVGQPGIGTGVTVIARSTNAQARNRAEYC